MVMEILLDILCHADFSGRLRKTPDSPGIAAFAAEVEGLRARNPGGTLLLSAGDECHEPSEDGCHDIGQP